MKKGDILVSSWGYEQTNIDFYEVVKATAKTVTVRELQQFRTDSGNMTGYVMPIKGKYKGDEMRRKVHYDCYNEDGFIMIESYEYARPWDGRKRGYTAYA